MGRVMFNISMFQCFYVFLSCCSCVCMYVASKFLLYCVSNCMYRHLDPGLINVIPSGLTYIGQRIIPFSLLSPPFLSYTPSPFYYLYQPILPLNLLLSLDVYNTPSHSPFHISHIHSCHLYPHSHPLCNLRDHLLLQMSVCQSVRQSVITLSQDCFITFFCFLAWS